LVFVCGSLESTVELLVENFVGGDFLVDEKKKKMTRQEAGKKGGEKVARERGTEFYREIGRIGGEKVAAQRGTEYYKKIGKKGGEKRKKSLEKRKT
jgi:general stress protein YciG